MKEAVRRRAAAVLMLVGLALALSTVFGSNRRECTLIFRFDDSLALSVRQLSATWTAAGDIEPTGGVTLNFSSGPGREVRHKLTVPEGDYVIALQIEPADAESDVGETALVRRVTLSGTDVVIPLQARGRE